MTNRLSEKKSAPSPGSTDSRRWFLYQAEGLSPEEIAARENVSLAVVEASIERMKEWKNRNSTSMLDTKIIEITMSQIEEVGKAFQRGLKARKVIFVDRETGKIKTADDIPTQLKTMAEIRGFAEVVRPKTPLIQNNTQFNNGQQGGGHSMSSGMSFEAVLRKKRAELGLANQQEIETADVMTLDAEIEDEFEEFGGSSDSDEEGEEGED